MWTKCPRHLFLTTLVLLQVPCTVVCGLRHKTACYNFPLIVDSPCAATEMILPTMFTLGVSSDVTCHSEIVGVSLRLKGVVEIRRCCQQRETDTVTEFCLPAMKNNLTDHFYVDFVNTCTASTKCQLSTPYGSKVQHTDGEDYVTFTFDCVHKDTVLKIKHDSTHTGQEVYLYNDQHDGEVRANCIAYSHACDSHVIIQLAAARVVSPAADCQVTFTDGDMSAQVDCKNHPTSSKCSSTMFESKSNYVDMSIFMTVDPGRKQKELLWIRAKTDTGKNVTVVCGANIPSDVSLHCPTTTSTTTTSTTATTPTTTTPTTTTVVTTTAVVVATATTATSTATTTTKQVTVTSNDVVNTQTSGVVTPSTETTSPTDNSKSTSSSTKESLSSTPRREASSPKVSDKSTSTKEPQPSTERKDVLIICASAAGAVLIVVMVTITVCVRRRKRNSSEKADQKREIMDKSQEKGYTSNVVGNSDDDVGFVANPVYEATDDYKMEQLRRKNCRDEGHAPAPAGHSLRKNSWVAQSTLDYYEDINFNDIPSGEDSEEKNDVRLSDLYAKVNKPRGTDQVTDIYAEVDMSRKNVRRTSGSCADEGENDDVIPMYAKVQK